MILTLVLTLVAFITLLPAYLSHRSMAKYRRAFQLRKWASFKDFEREFYKVQWERDIFNKHSFKPLDNYNRSMSNLSLESNYIEASIVIVNETQFIFQLPTLNSLGSYLRIEPLKKINIL